MMNETRIVELVKNGLIDSGSTFSKDKKDAYIQAIEKETSERAKWVLQTILKNAEVAEKRKSPLCDDTGIPHLILEVGPDYSISGRTLSAIKQGVKEGLRSLPGRPMGITGEDDARISQKGMLDSDPAGVEIAPIIIRQSEENVLKLHILMLGGGPAIRGKTYRVFHKHDTQIVIDEIINWATESVSLIGCTPCTIAVGIGRSQTEASSLMLQAMVDGKYNVQSVIERTITERVNETNVGPLGLGGKTSVLATFVKVGPQRASGVRIVSMRPCCCFEPRIATINLIE